MPTQLPILNPQSPPRHLRAFTLIELLVVMTIVVVMATISIPAIKALTNGNGQKQAANLITTLIASAHANALQSHTYAGLVFYEDPSHAGQTAAQLIQASTTSNLPNISFIRQPRTVGQPMSRGVVIATLDDPTAATAGVNSPDYGTPPQTRVILFDPNGQLTLHGSFVLDSSIPATDKAAAAWNIGNGASSPGIFIYDQQALQSAKDTSVVHDAASYALWVNNHADVLIINSYTGSIIR